jgi:nicotinamidase-related amidase
LAQLVAIYRSPAYSPQQHRVNDTAILDATVGRLERQGWRAIKTTELEVGQGRLPAGELYLNMCQGSLAAEQLMPFESDGVVVVNRASSALNCHRYRLVKRLADSPLAFPRTLIHASSAPLPPAEQLQALSPDHQKVWIKRGDVHAERPEDVLATSLEQMAEALRAFTARGIPWVALQEHVPGPVVKFYGVTDGRFFRWYGSDAGFAGERPRVDENRLKALAFEAAAILGLEVFGGDIAFPEPDRPVLIDINDWPSFAPFREDAAQAIAAYITHRFAHRKHA